MPDRRGARQVVMVAFDGALLLDVTGPAEVFAMATALLAAEGREGYRLTTTSCSGTVGTFSGLSVITVPLPSIAPVGIDTLMVAGGPGVQEVTQDHDLVGWIAAHVTHVRRVCSVCTGAFLLAAAGLLSGRRVATHWQACALLKELYPDVRVEADPIFIRDGHIWTSAGVTAGIDLALALVQEDFGHRLAMQVAQRLVVFLKRPGGQAQFSAPLAAQMAAAGRDEDGRLLALQAWIAEHLAADLRVEQLAERARMSPRTFARLFTTKTGTTPAKAVEAMRLEAARRALEETTVPIKCIALDCGFRDEERMRRAFVRCLGVSPLDYRARFSA
jgi:transcriptional regulator GlxA family with amidase domain